MRATSGDDEREELAPSLRTTRTRLQDEVAAAAQAADAAATDADAAAASLGAATAAVASKWDKVQLYWLKGFAPSLDGLLSAVAAGIPLRAILRVHDPSHAPVADASAALQLYQQIAAAQAASTEWDDPVMSIAAVDVSTGPQGGRFVPAGHYTDSAAATPIGAVEMQAALRAVEACAGPYDKWAAARKVYPLASSSQEAGLFHRLMGHVPAEQQSVPVLMHCMLEQVACNVEATGEAVAEGCVVTDAAARFERALEGALGDTAVRKAEAADEFEYSTVLYGDEAAMAARGLISGHVQPQRKRTPLPLPLFPHALLLNNCADLSQSTQQGQVGRV